MEVLVNAMPCIWNGNIDQPASFSIVDFKPGTLGKLIKAVVGSTEKIEPPTTNRTDIGKSFLFNVLGQAKRDIKNGLSSIFVSPASTLGLIERQDGFVVGQSGYSASRS
jgi:hypothetical protein